jgi:SAM-dependent methyltransferase
MRVLDVGCGGGDLTFLVAKLVRSGGRVVGVDRSREALSAARARQQETGAANVEFVHGDLEAEALDLPKRAFDALVGRTVLYVCQDPVKALRGLLTRVRPGGIVAFHERSALYGQAWLPKPLWQTVGHWFLETIRRSGTDGQFGLKLYGVFVEAGLPPPHLQHDICIDGGQDSLFYEWMAASVSSALPAMVRYGVARAADIDVDTLAERLRVETVSAAGALIPMSLIGAWSRTRV